MSAKLSQYNKKRDFDKTAEPKGEVADSGKKLRFVVQHHIASRDHFDFRLEWQGTLLSWAVPKGPSYNTRDKRLAIHVEDHPLDYRNFEGTIPKGQYGGGTVMLWDEGYWEPQKDAEEGLKNGALKMILHGKRLRGKWALIRLKMKVREKDDNWLLLKEKDDFAQDEAAISQFDTSIRTGRTMDEITKGLGEKHVKNPFKKVTAQAAKLVDSVPDEDGWLYELKYDGYRILAFIEGNKARLLTRNDKDYTEKFTDVADSLINLAGGRPMVLDGEMVVADKNGKTDFQALQNYVKRGKNATLTFIVFDLLALDGDDLREKPLIERKKSLENLLKKSPANLHYSKHVEGEGDRSFQTACQSGMEGIIGKQADSKYSGKRNGDWIKIKCDNRQEFVIAGYTVSNKSVRGLSSVLLGVYEEGDLVYVGRAGTGFTKDSAEELLKKFKPLIRKTTPFKSPPKARSGEEVTWLRPSLVAEIKFAEWTDKNHLRQASFKGLRVDKKPKDVIKESGKEKVSKEEKASSESKTKSKKATANKSTKSNKATANQAKEKPTPKEDPPPKAKKTSGEDTVTINRVKITNPQRIVFDDTNTTKEEVVRYYADISDRMLPYIKNRVLSIVRCPRGVSESCFYKKHPGPGSDAVVTIPVTNSKGKSDDYFYIKNLTGLVQEAQMGTLEFHTWGSRVDNLEKPDMMVFDLDPDEGMDIDRVRQGVVDLRSILDDLSLSSYLKTSGGKGYHIVIPLRPSTEWDAFNSFAKGVAEVMVQKWPDRYTSNVRKINRKDKIFIDWIRNGRGATSVAPYSLRARPGAKVSMPITWEELYKVAPDDIDMNEALKRAKKDDPWDGFFRRRQGLK